MNCFNCNFYCFLGILSLFWIVGLPIVYCYRFLCVCVYLWICFVLFVEAIVFFTWAPLFDLTFGIYQTRWSLKEFQQNKMSWDIPLEIIRFFFLLPGLSDKWTGLYLKSTSHFVFPNASESKWKNEILKRKKKFIVSGSVIENLCEAYRARPVEFHFVAYFVDMIHITLFTWAEHILHIIQQIHTLHTITITATHSFMMLFYVVIASFVHFVCVFVFILLWCRKRVVLCIRPRRSNVVDE